jgi:choline dehydrogenase
MYDYVVVGGGTAGAIIASRLSEDRDVRVLLIEAGSSNRSIRVAIPAALIGLMGEGPQNWGFYSEPEAHLDNRPMYTPRGKGLGGSSAINGMAFVRGHRADYDHWSEMGAVGWDYDAVLPYFRDLESYSGPTNEYRGNAGPMPVTSAAVDNPLYNAFIEAGVQSGYKWNRAFNAADHEGIGRFDCNISHGIRQDTGRVYLRPASGRSNLTVLTDARVARVLLDQDQATGVEYFDLKSGDFKAVYVNREVILCAGALQTPQILQLSGIGDPDELNSAGVCVRHELPGVGKNLQDHLAASLTYSAKGDSTIYARTYGLKKIAVGLDYILFRRGPVAEAVIQAGGFLRTRPELNQPDMQFHLLGAIMGHNKKPISGFLVRTYLVKPESRGGVRLRSNDPMDTPRIQFNYLSTEADRKGLCTAVRTVRNLVAQPAMRPFVDAELQPGFDASNDEALEAWLRATTTTAYHPVGTCRMGHPDDRDAVTDSKLRIRGLGGIRIADASVMPEITTGNTAAPTMMIAEKAADS